MKSKLKVMYKYEFLGLCTFYTYFETDTESTGVAGRIIWFRLILQVLTANIGTLLDVYGVEKGLEHFRSTSSLNF
jgi:hypothetical protein